MLSREARLHDAGSIRTESPLYSRISLWLDSPRKDIEMLEKLDDIIYRVEQVEDWMDAHKWHILLIIVVVMVFLITANLLASRS